MGRELEVEFFHTMRSKARRLNEDVFVRASPGLYLLGRLPEDDSDECRRSFTTVPAVAIAEIEDAIRIEKQRRASGGRFLCKVEKSARNPWRGRISVGRAANNDVVIEHPSVSKLHAHFVLDEPDPLGLDGVPGLRLTDAGSRNGTRLNGTALADLSQVELRPGDRMMFGAVLCDLLSAQSLHRIMRSRFPGR